jgi:hypothetical protein
LGLDNFVARLLGQLLARTKPPLLKRLRPALGLTAIVLWLLVLLAGYPAFKDYQYKSLINTIITAGVRAVPKDDGSHELDFSQAHPGSFNRLINQLYHMPSIVKLELIGDKDLTNLNLEKLTQLQSLDISFNDRLTTITGLESLQNLREVKLDEEFIIPIFDKISILKNLQKLYLKDNPKMRKLAETLNQNRKTNNLPPVEFKFRSY